MADLRFIEEEAAQTAPQSLRVLYIEDDETDAQLFFLTARKLQKYILNIDHCETCEEAFRLASSKPYDLCIFDFWVRGETTVRLIDHFGGRFSKAPIILLTGLENTTIQEIGERAGAIAFLPKAGISSSLLESLIFTALHTYQLERALRVQIDDAEQSTRAHFDQLGSKLKTLLASVDRFHAINALSISALEQGRVSEADQFLRDNAELAHSVRHELYQAIAGLHGSAADSGAVVQVSDLSRVLSSVRKQFAYEVKLRRGELLVCMPDAPVDILTDPLIVQEAISQLVAKAIRENAEGTSVEISLLQNDETVSIAISDDGNQGGPIGRSPASRTETYVARWAPSNVDVASPNAALPTDIHRIGQLLDLVDGELTVKAKTPTGTTATIVLPAALPR